jgi:hypothetical protein
LIKELLFSMRNPFDNKVDADVVYEAKIASGVFGCDTKVSINIQRNHDVCSH